MTDMWEQLDPNDCGLFGHYMVNTDIIIWIGDFDYTVCDGAVPLANFTTIEAARAFAEEMETWWTKQREAS